MRAWVGALCLAASCLPAAAPAKGAVDPRDAEPVTVRMRPAADAVYPGEDLAVTLTYKNAGERKVILPPELFARESFRIADDRGRPPKVARGGAHPPEPEPLAVDGYGEAARRVSLSAWYPKVAVRGGAWTVTWSAGPWQAGPLRIVVTRPYDAARDRRAVLETDLGTMIWDLLPERAPEHVKRFVDLSRQGFYDGLTLFRVTPRVQVEGGDPKGDGTGAWDELLMPEIDPALEVGAGMVGASRVSSSSSMTSASMFFITIAPAPFMQGKHTFYARLSEGWEVLARAGRAPNRGDTGMTDAFRLVTPVSIRRVTIK